MSWQWEPGQLDRLGDFLFRNGLVDAPVGARQIGDGHSNLTFLVDDGERSMVVRRPPPPPLPPGGHDVVREARVMRALAGTGVPVPEVYAVGAVGEVFDVPFYVMSLVAGPVVTVASPREIATPASRRLAGESVVDTLVALHAVDWQAAGLEGFGRPEGFNARHVQRLRRLLSPGDAAVPEPFAAIDAWLTANVPAESDHRLVHLDYRLGNLVVAPHPPARVAAVLDWELSTLGDPLWDVGYLLASWPVPGEAPTPVSELGVAVYEPGWPTRDDLAARYAAVSGRSLDSLAWYVAAGQWKLAVLYEYGRRRAAGGHGDPYYADPRLVQRFLAAAHHAAGLHPS